ncbi:hypothetical protein [Variovorax soli]|uniref:Uncharacterized protein n=1 Tax=Variovorax soli TaxID=376815 RepID=A0ABU1NFE6_9BURK|nr:hypothetical protein [Variovorax soli]MDR6537022.1 hypothetical protein [Variovorax soli]
MDKGLPHRKLAGVEVSCAFAAPGVVFIHRRSSRAAGRAAALYFQRLGQVALDLREAVPTTFKEQNHAGR